MIFYGEPSVGFLITVIIVALVFICFGIKNWGEDRKEKKMTRDEMKNRISLALKDPVLQQGFEIICKNLSELEKENAKLKVLNKKMSERIERLEGYERIVKKLQDNGFDTFMSIKEFCKEKIQLEKENAELREEIKNNEDLATVAYMQGATSRERQITELEKVKRIERGWAGHFCCSDSCKFRRNTLLEYNGKAVVVSTVGAMYNNKGELEEIGIGRHYETMAFYADDSEYKDADVRKQIYFDSPWSLKWHEDGYIDNEVNAMHEKVVEEISKNLLKGVL